MLRFFFVIIGYKVKTGLSKHFKKSYNFNLQQLFPPWDIFFTPNQIVEIVRALLIIIVRTFIISFEFDRNVNSDGS